MAFISMIRRIKLRADLRRRDEVYRIIGPLVLAPVVDYLDPLWMKMDHEDPDIHERLVQWMLAKYEIEQLEVCIDEGVQVRKKLSPIDPMRRTMQVEIETLRSRRDMLHADRQEQADSITQTAREYLDEMNRERAEEQRQEKYETRMREIGDKEQARLEAQERAQNWLHGEE